MKLSRRQLRRLIESAMGPLSSMDPGDGAARPGLGGSTIDGSTRSRGEEDAREDRLLAKSKQNFMLNCQAIDFTDATLSPGKPEDELLGNSLFKAIVEAHNAAAFEFLDRHIMPVYKGYVSTMKDDYADIEKEYEFVTIRSGILRDKTFDSSERIDQGFSKFNAGYSLRRLRIDKTGNKVKVTIAVKGFGSMSHTANYMSQYNASEVDYDQINFLDFLDKSTSVQPPRLKMK